MSSAKARLSKKQNSRAKWEINIMISSSFSWFYSFLPFITLFILFIYLYISNYLLSPLHHLPLSFVSFILHFYSCFSYSPLFLTTHFLLYIALHSFSFFTTPSSSSLSFLPFILILHSFTSPLLLSFPPLFSPSDLAEKDRERTNNFMSQLGVDLTKGKIVIAPRND